ncbi:MAG: leucine-rich repeat protein [Lachnospiraceae bacterium]|nr:leucine-rich repeat protein [Lachnospiraceae bacterium]
MKKKLSLFMAAVMLLTTPASVSLASDASDAIIAEDDVSTIEMSQDDKSSIDTIDKNQLEETETLSSNEDVPIIDAEESAQINILETANSEEQMDGNNVLSEKDEVSIIDVSVVDLNLCGTWEGTYKGTSSDEIVERSIKLCIDYCDSKSIFEGMAEIDEGEKGIYFFTGTIDYETREVTFEGIDWVISTDSSFSFASFSGSISNDFTVMEGIVSSDSNRTFTITKTSDTYSTTRIDINSVALDWIGEYDGHSGDTIVRRNYEIHILNLDEDGNISGIAIISPSDKTDSLYGLNGSYYFSGTINFRTGKITIQGYEWIDYPDYDGDFSFVVLTGVIYKDDGIIDGSTENGIWSMVVLNESNYCGDNLTWSIDDGVLTISGTGDMYDWSTTPEVPWAEYAEEITSIVIEDGVTSIGDNAFNGYTSITSVTIADTVTSIGDSSFMGCTGLTSIEIPDSVITIGEYAFALTGLETVTIGTGLETVGNDAFYNCENITDVYYNGSEEEWSEIEIGSDNDTLVSTNIHLNGETDDDSSLDTTTDYSSDIAAFLSNEGTLNAIKYLYLDSNFTNSIYVYQNDESFSSTVTMVISDLIYRGTEGRKDLIDASTSIEEAEEILAALLEVYQADCEELAMAKNAKKYAKYIVSAWEDYSKTYSIFNTLTDDELEMLNGMYSENSIAQWLYDGNYDSIVDDFKNFYGYTDNDDVVKTLKSFMESAELAKTLSKGLGFLGDGLKIISLTQDTVNYLYQLESLCEADEMYLEMLLYIKNNCQYSVVSTAASNLYSVIKGTYKEQVLYVSTSLLNEFEDAAIDAAISEALVAIPCGEIIKAGFEWGVNISNYLVHVDDIQELKDQMRIISYLGNCLQMWCAENQTLYYDSDGTEKNEYAEKLYYGLYMLWQTRIKGEEALQSMFKKSLMELSRYYTISLQISSTLELFGPSTTSDGTALEGTLFSKQNMAMMSLSISCPVDVEVYNSSGELILTVNDRAESSGYANGIYYYVKYHELDGDYVKILCYPKNGGYTFKCIGNDLGVVDSIVMTIENEGDASFQYIENISVQEEDIITISSDSDGIYTYVKTDVQTEETTSRQLNQSTSDYVTATNVSLSNSEIELDSGEQVLLTATFNPENATCQQLIWESSDSSVAVVNSDGVVTAISEGTALITAASQYDAVSAVCTVSVKSDAETDISVFDIILVIGNYTFDGTAKKPSVTVTNGTTTLVEGTDYTVSYSNNVYVGTATVTITGIGNYTGTATTTFLITSANSGSSSSSTTVKNGLTLDSDGVYRYYKSGVFAETFAGVVEYDGGYFFVANGLLCSDAHGLNLYGDTWYFLAYGQVQTQYTGFALYEGEWFYITEGVLDTNVNGLMTYDGEEFLFAEGHLLDDYSGLWLNSSEIGGDNQWYFIACGMLQNVSQVAMYDGEWFVVKNGILDTSYNGTIEYDGATFNVKNGQLYSL